MLNRFIHFLLHCLATQRSRESTGEKSNPISLNCLPSLTRTRRRYILYSEKKKRKRGNLLFRLDRRLIFHEFIGNLELILLVFDPSARTLHDSRLYIIKLIFNDHVLKLVNIVVTNEVITLDTDLDLRRKAARVCELPTQ